jgi:transcription-repair coupling factor (superfamily II helicase)
LYQELDAVESEEALEKFEKELIDRFGPLPEPAKELLLSIHLRMLAKKLGFERIVMKNNMMLCYFIGNKDSKYFQSEAFGKVLALLAEQKSIELKDKNNKLYLRIPQISTISQGIQKLNQLV